jgi:hypothetical protein
MLSGMRSLPWPLGQVVEHFREHCTAGFHRGDA